LRQQAGVKQYEIAQALAIDPSLVSRYERGSRPAPDRVIRYYAQRFGDADLLEAFAEIARESDRVRMKLRDPELIAKQAAYPLPGDQASFIGESPPDGVTIPLGATFQKTWTIRNSGTVPWRGRRLRRIGPIASPWTLRSDRFISIPDAEPGQRVTISTNLRAPHTQAVAVAQWKMVDEEDLLYFPTEYSVGLGVHVLIGHAGDSSA